MKGEEIMVWVPLDLYNEGVTSIAKIRSFGAYVNQEKYSIDREIAAAMLDFTLPGEKD